MNLINSVGFFRHLSNILCRENGKILNVKPGGTSTLRAANGYEQGHLNMFIASILRGFWLQHRMVGVLVNNK